MAQSRIKELEKENKDLRKLVKKLEEDIKQLQLIADYDFLTKLYNRHGFIREITRFMAALHAAYAPAVPGGKKRKNGFRIGDLSFIFIDLDDLKTINDHMGHRAGDKFLQAAAAMFEKNIRDVDIICRWGGDEFLIALIDTAETDASRVAQKLKRGMAAIKIPGMEPGHRFTASFGVVSAVDHAKKEVHNLYELIERSDQAMYDAKIKQGKNSVIVFSELPEHHARP